MKRWRILWEGFSYLDSCELILNSYVSTIYPLKSTWCNWGFALSVVRFPSFCTLVEEKWKEGYGWVVIFKSLRMKQALHNALSINSQVPLPWNTHMSLASSCTVTWCCNVEALWYCSVCCAYTECLTDFWGGWFVVTDDMYAEQTENPENPLRCPIKL